MSSTSSKSGKTTVIPFPSESILNKRGFPSVAISMSVWICNRISDFCTFLGDEFAKYTNSLLAVLNIEGKLRSLRPRGRTTWVHSGDTAAASPPSDRRSTAVVACGRGFPARHTSSTPPLGRAPQFTRSSPNVRNVLYAYHLCLARQILRKDRCVDRLDLGNVRQIIMAVPLPILDSLNDMPSMRFAVSCI